MRIGRYESSEGSNVGTAITFLLIGLGAGALVGLLLAPKSGRELRRDIKRGYDDTKDAIGEWAEGAAETVKERVREAGERVRVLTLSVAGRQWPMPRPPSTGITAPVM